MNKKLKFDTIKTIGVTLKINTPSLAKHFIEIKKAFSKHDVTLMLDKDFSALIKKEHLKDIKVVSLKTICETSDIIVCCGGDGTLLNLVRYSFSHKKPIIGIPGGNLSFLLNIKIKYLEKFVKNIFIDKFKVNEHMMLKVEHNKRNTVHTNHIFNDIVFKRKDSSKSTKINLFVNDELINSYTGDGLIIATPTGSTAYNLWAKGPIVHPSIRCIIVTPICAHGFTQNPLVLPEAFKLSIQSQDNDTIAILDGHTNINIKDTKIHIVTSKYKVHMLHMRKNEYVKSLKEKLLWGT